MRVFLSFPVSLQIDPTASPGFLGVAMLFIMKFLLFDTPKTEGTALKQRGLVS